MGLFGLFGGKKSEAQKAYEKVYDKFPSKKVSVSDMEAAIHAWEAADGEQNEVWKAYFKMGIVLDCGLFNEVDEGAAAKHHEKVRTLIKASGNSQYEQWETYFYFWYNQSAINRYKEFNKQTCNIRRLGNAEMNVLGMTGNGCMFKEIKRMISDLYYNTNDDAAKAAKAFDDYMGICSLDWDDCLKDHNSPDYNAQGMDVGIKDFEKRASKEEDKFMKLTKKKQPENLENDLTLYIYAFQFFNKSPLNFATAYDNVNNPLAYGIKKLITCVYMGNSMALHKLVYLVKSNDGKYQQLAESLFSSEYRSLDAFLLNNLEMCETQGDATARELINRYFTE